MITMAVSPLEGSSARARGSGAGAQCGLEAAWGVSGRLTRTEDSFQSAISVLELRASKSVHALFKYRVLVSYSPPVNPNGFQVR